MNTEGRPTTGHRSPTRAMILAWADTHSVDVSNAEADDLVRRLWCPPTPFDAEAVEKCVVDALLLLAESEEHDESTAESLRRLASQVSAVMLTLKRMPDGQREPDSTSDITERVEAEDDGAPGTAVGEEGCRPLRYDLIYRKPVRVTLHGKRLLALHPPFDGRVRLRPERGETRATVVPLDELAPSDRARLKAPIRRRQEILVRCANRRCGSVFRAWLADGDELSIQETGGRCITDVHGVFMARCEEHRLVR